MWGRCGRAKTHPFGGICVSHQLRVNSEEDYDRTVFWIEHFFEGFLNQDDNIRLSGFGKLIVFSELSSSATGGCFLRAATVVANNLVLTFGGQGPSEWDGMTVCLNRWLHIPVNNACQKYG